MAYWMAAMAVADAWIGSSSAHKANRTNIQLQREQQAFEQRNADTAMQRRVKDLTLSGLNPVLAAGSNGASSPSVPPATVEPTYRGGGASSAAAMVNMAAEVKNKQAQTNYLNAQTKGQDIKNNVDNAFAWNIAELNMDLKNIKKQNDSKAYDLLDAQIENTKKQGQNLVQTGQQTALQNEQMRKMMDAVVATAKQQARAGQIDLEALENVASVYAVEANKTQGFVKLVIDAARLFFQNNRGGK